MKVMKINMVAIRAMVSIFPIKAKPAISNRMNVNAAKGVLRFGETKDKKFRAFVSLDILSNTLELPSILDKMVFVVANKAITEIIITPVLP